MHEYKEKRDAGLTKLSQNEAGQVVILDMSFSSLGEKVAMPERPISSDSVSMELNMLDNQIKMNKERTTELVEQKADLQVLLTDVKAKEDEIEAAATN